MCLTSPVTTQEPAAELARAGLGLEDDLTADVLRVRRRA